MAFASPRSTPRTSNTRNGGSTHRSSPRNTPRTTEFETTAAQQTYLWPSETDPNRAHWLRNEVIAFERVLVTLRKERDDAVEVLHGCEVARERAIAPQEETQREVDELEAKGVELEAKNQEQIKELARLQTELDDAVQAKEILTKSNSELSQRLAVLDTEHTKLKETASLQQLVQLQLQRKCANSQTELSDLRSNPKVPEEYSNHVEQTEQAHQARIATLQEELQKLLAQEDSISEDNKKLQQELQGLTQEVVDAEASAGDAKEALDRQNEKRAELETELMALQHQYYLTPEKVEEEEVVKEVVVEVQRGVVFE